MKQFLTLQSKLFTKTTRETSSEEPSLNARFLVRAGYISRSAAGIYSLLPLGLRVISNIENIIREELTALGCEEVLMPALVAKEYLETSGRWDSSPAIPTGVMSRTSRSSASARPRPRARSGSARPRST